MYPACAWLEGGFALAVPSGSGPGQCEGGLRVAPSFVATLLGLLVAGRDREAGKGNRSLPTSSQICQAASPDEHFHDRPSHGLAVVMVRREGASSALYLL